MDDEDDTPLAPFTLTSFDFMMMDMTRAVRSSVARRYAELGGGVYGGMPAPAHLKPSRIGSRVSMKMNNLISLALGRDGDRPFEAVADRAGLTRISITVLRWCIDVLSGVRDDEVNYIMLGAA